jgi:hypothetical protein
LEDHVQVLLKWYRSGQYWVRVTGENEVSVEHLLLFVLKDVADPQLRKEIRETLTVEPDKKTENKGDTARQAAKTGSRKKRAKKFPDR